MVEVIVFVACAAVVLGGAVGVVVSRNPVHSALSLVATLFGIAVLFVSLEAHLLAAVQVIVYTGAIVVLILFVLMLLGVDRAEDLETEPIAGQRVLAVASGIGILGASLLAFFALAGDDLITGQPGAIQAITDEVPNVEAVGELLFTDYIAAFEITGVLLTIAVVAAVLMVRKPPASVVEDDEPPNALEEVELTRQAASDAAAQARAEAEAEAEAAAAERKAAAADDTEQADEADDEDKAEVD